MSETTPKRVRVTRSTPYGRAAAQPARAGPAERVPGPGPWPAPPSIDEITDPVAAVYEGELRRAQLRWALVSVAVVAVPLFALPLVLAGLAGPAGPSQVRVLAIGAGWAVLSVVIYPMLWLAARRFIRGAERIDAEHLEEIGRRRAGPG